MLRNFSKRNGLQFFPGRICENITGVPKNIKIAIEIIILNGSVINKIIKEATISNTLFI
jgi:hypothetical protein